IALRDHFDGLVDVHITEKVTMTKDGVSHHGKDRVWLVENNVGAWHEIEAGVFVLYGQPTFRHSRRITLGKERIWVASDGKDSVFFDCTNGVMPRRLAFGLPAGIKATFDLKDHGLRFIDLDGDGYDDIVFSNEQGYGVYLFKDMKEGWSRKVIAGKAG